MLASVCSTSGKRIDALAGALTVLGDCSKGSAGAKSVDEAAGSVFARLLLLGGLPRFAARLAVAGLAAGFSGGADC